jgi:hypothetical protein
MGVGGSLEAETGEWLKNEVDVTAITISFSNESLNSAGHSNKLWFALDLSGLDARPRICFSFAQLI